MCTVRDGYVSEWNGDDERWKLQLVHCRDVSKRDRTGGCWGLHAVWGRHIPKRERYGEWRELHFVRGWNVPERGGGVNVQLVRVWMVSDRSWDDRVYQL